MRLFTCCSSDCAINGAIERLATVAGGNAAFFKVLDVVGLWSTSNCAQHGRSRLQLVADTATRFLRDPYALLCVDEVVGSMVSAL